MTLSKKDILYLSIVLVLIAAVFGNVLDNYFLRDETAMLRNIRDFEKVLQLFVGFRLIPALLFKGVHAVWGLDPRGYYVLNLGLHAVNALLVYFCAALLFSTETKSLNSRAGFLSALYFSVTFSHHEAVYYIPGISDLVSALFCLLSLFYFIIYSAGARPWPLALSVFFFVLFLLSKPTAVLFPFALIALASARNVPLKMLAPFFVFLGLYSFLPWVRAENKGLLPSYFQSAGLFSFFPVLLFYMADFIFSLFGFTSSALWFEFPYGYFGAFANPNLIQVSQCLLFLAGAASFGLFVSGRLLKKRKGMGRNGSDGKMPPAALTVFLVVSIVLLFLPQAFLPELYPVQGKLIQYRYLYVPACFFAMLLARLMFPAYDALKKNSLSASRFLMAAMAFIVALNAYETYAFGKSMNRFSDFARWGVGTLSRYAEKSPRGAAVAMVLNPPSLLEAYYKTCLTDMVAVHSGEKVQMAWAHSESERLFWLEEAQRKRANVFYFVVNERGFMDVTESVRFSPKQK